MFGDFQALYQVELAPKRKRRRHVERPEGGPRDGQLLRINIWPVHPKHFIGSVAEPTRKPYTTATPDIEHAAARKLGSNMRKQAVCCGGGGLVCRSKKTVVVDIRRLLQFPRAHDLYASGFAAPALSFVALQ